MNPTKLIWITATACLSGCARDADNSNPSPAAAILEQTVTLQPRTPEQQQRRPRTGTVRDRPVPTRTAYSFGNAPGTSAPSSFATVAGNSFGIYNVAGDAVSTDSVSYRGGAIIQNVNLQLIFWGSAWTQPTSPSQGDVVNAVNKMINSTYFAGMTQYSYQDIRLRGALTVLNDPPGTFSFDDVGNLVWDLIDQGTFPEPDDDHIMYMVFMPQSANFNNPNVRGSHSDPWDYDFPWTVQYAWVAWSGFGTIDFITDVFSHELIESISDPEPNHGEAWIMNRQINGGDEIGDACNNTVDFLDGVLVQAYWSQAQRACVIPFEPPPTVTFLFPSSGGPEGGTQVRIQGSNFDTKGSTKVFFGSVPASNVSCPRTDQCFANSPPGNGIADVTVKVNRFTSATSSSSKYYYSPSITSVSPPYGTVGDTVTIQGVGFGTSPSISFGPFPVTQQWCYPGPDCVVTVPPGSGVVDVRITVNGHTTAITPADRFSYRGPTITRIDTTHGPIAGGTYVHIFGSGFDPNAANSNNMQAFFGGLQTDYLLCMSSTWCSIRSPAVSWAGPVHITVRTFGTSSTPTAADLFTYDWRPTLTEITASANPATVRFNGIASGAVVTLTSSDPNAVSVPPTVTVPAGWSGANFQFTLVPILVAETVTLTASYDGVTVSTTVNAPAWPALSIQIGADSLDMGQSSTATVSMVTPAPAGGAVITLSSSDAATIPVPASVTIPAGGHQASFPITNSSYSGLPKAVTIGAAYDSQSASAPVWVPTTPACRPRRCPRGTWWDAETCTCQTGLPR